MLEKKETAEEQRAVFMSKPFKRGAIDFYAKYVLNNCNPNQPYSSNSNSYKIFNTAGIVLLRWVALNVVSAEYMEHIKHTQRELYNHIRESPTYEQAKRDIGDLAKTFLKDVETAQEDLKRKCAESEDEKKALDAPPSPTQES